MKLYKIEDMRGGWYCGDFSPSCLKTKDVEVAFKTYDKGDRDIAHYHNVATEVTLITKGAALFNFIRLKEIHLLRKGDIVLIEPGEVVGFSAIEDTETVCVKLPSVLGDKYIV